MSEKNPQNKFESQDDADISSTPRAFKFSTNAVNPDLDEIFENLQHLRSRYEELFNNFQNTFGSNAPKPESLNEIDRLIGIINNYHQSDDSNSTKKDLERYSRKLETQLIKAEEDCAKLLDKGKKEESASDKTDFGGSFASENVSELNSPEPLSEPTKLNDLEKTGLLVRASNFDHLYILMEKTGPIEGSTKDFSVDVVKDIVEEIYKLPVTERKEAQRQALRYVTKQNGFRDVIARCFEIKDEELSLDNYFDNSPFNDLSVPKSSTDPREHQNPEVNSNASGPNHSSGSNNGGSQASAADIPSLEDKSKGPEVVLTKAEKENILNEAKTFDELLEAMDIIGPIQGSGKVYISDDIRSFLDKVGNYKIISPDTVGDEINILLITELNKITNTYGLRNLVGNLAVESLPEFVKKLKLVHMYAHGDKNILIRPETRDADEQKKRKFSDVRDEFITTMEFARIPQAEKDKALADINEFHTDISALKAQKNASKKENNIELVNLVQQEIDREYEKLLARMQAVFAENAQFANEPSVPKSSEEINEAAVDSENNSPDTYQGAKENLFTAKAAFLKKQAEYKKVFEKRSILTKVKDGVGFNNFELQKLKIESDRLRSDYAKALDIAITERSKVKMSVNDKVGNVREEVKNKDYTLEADQTKIAFVKKFILTPRLKNLEWIESLKSKEKKKALKNIGDYLKKRKWALRAGVVVGAGLLAGLTGGAAAGLVAGGYKASRMLMSTTAGAAAAAATNLYTNRWVDEAGKNLNNTVHEAEKNFDLDNINSLEAGIIKADEKVNFARNRQTVATIGAAVLAGGGVGAGLEAFSSASDFEVTSTTGVVNKVSNIELKMAPGIDILDADKESMNVEIKNSIDNILADHPNYSEEKLEGILSEMLEKKFGSNVWWPENGVRVDLDIEKIDTNNQAVEIDNSGLVNQGTEEPVEQASIKELAIAKALAESNDIDVKLPEQLPSEIYEVQPHDTLSKIVNDHFKEKLSQVPEGRYNATLYNLLDKIESNEKLAGSLGLDTGKEDFMDVIHPGERLNLSVLDEELDRLIEAENTKEEAVNTTNISTESASEIVANQEFKIDPENIEVEKPKLSVLDIKDYEVNKLNNDLDIITQNSDRYQSLAKEYFADDRAFQKAVNASVEKFELNSYSFTEKLFGIDYSSPFKVMSNMNIEEISSVANGPTSEARAFCEQNNLKYDTFRAWTDVLDNMQNKFAIDPKDTLVIAYERNMLFDKVSSKLA